MTHPDLAGFSIHNATEHLLQGFDREFDLPAELQFITLKRKPDFPDSRVTIHGGSPEEISTGLHLKAGLNQTTGGHFCSQIRCG
jgi:hypothetical protein